MNNPIMLTPHDLWNIFLAFCGGLVAVSAAVAVVVTMNTDAIQMNKL